MIPTVQVSLRESRTIELLPLPDRSPYNEDGKFEPIEGNHAALRRSYPPDELH